MAVVSFLPPAVVYREEQNFEWWVYALVALVEFSIGLVLLAAVKQGHVPMVSTHLSKLVVLFLVGLISLGIPTFLAAGFLRMTTEVTPSDLRVWFGWVPTYRRLIAIGAVGRVEVVSFRPILDHGGWGIRSSRNGERVLSARGRRGVRIELLDGSVLLIGSQRPEELATAIETSRRPGG